MICLQHILYMFTFFAFTDMALIGFPFLNLQVGIKLMYMIIIIKRSRTTLLKVLRAIQNIGALEQKAGISGWKMLVHIKLYI